MTYAVPQPVGSSRESNTTGSNWKREDLANDDPSTRTPCRSKEEDVDADEGDFSLDGGRVASINGSSNGNDEFTDQHAKGTPDQQRTAAEALNGIEGYWSGADVDEGGDEAD